MRTVKITLRNGLTVNIPEVESDGFERLCRALNGGSCITTGVPGGRRFIFPAHAIECIEITEEN